MSLYIIRAKPNPFGKDKYGQYAPNSQLNGEWIDIQNTSGKDLNMAGVKIYDHTFDVYGRDEGRREIFTFGQWTMPKGTIIRIHSGERVDVNTLPLVDRTNADFHTYTGYSYYVWNNVWGDTGEIRNSSNVLIDNASYGPNPQEGKILIRHNSHLI